MTLSRKTRVLAPVVAAAGMAAASIGGGAGAFASVRPHSGAPTLSISDFNVSFSAMAKLKPLVAEGKGPIAAILPDTVSSTRYVEFDAPYLKEAFKDAGLSSSQFIVENAQGSASTELTDAQAAIAKGAKVIILDPLDSGSGARIELYAKARGVDVIDYDRLTLGGYRKYYDSFNNVQVGTLIGNGFTSCVTAWGVKSPNVLVMHGAATDNNATLFAQGYNAVLAPYFADGKYTLAGRSVGTWDPPTAETEFQQAITADPKINAAVIPNDENGAPIITYLKTLGVKPHTFPTTGQDATLTGLQNILAGYQCGTVYKPIYLEAQAAVALAMYLRAGVTPPKTLVNNTTKDPQTGKSVLSVLLTPEWVTPSNMNSTVIKDKFVPAAQLCAGYSAQCSAAGITS
jgi:D-xylose transport system substrate-binding protein